MFKMLRTVFLGISLGLVMCGHSFAAGDGVVRLDLPDAGPVGKGSAFVGEANRPSAVYYNPAGIVQLKTAMSLGLTTIQPQFNYKSPSGEKYQMRREWTTFPHLYFVTPVVENKFYIGVGENSNWGLGSDWNPNAFNRYSCYKSEFENKDLMLVGAYKFNDQWSFAVGADNDDSKIDKEKKLFQATKGDANMQMKAKDNAWGFRVATLFKLNDIHQFGLMYRSPIHHTYEGKVYLDDLDNGAGPTDYKTFFGGSSYETGVKTKFVLPQSIILGYSYKPNKKWTFNADVEWLDWSSVKEQAFEWTDETDVVRLMVLNTGNPQSRDWKSVFSTSLGAEYAVNDKLRVRGGYVFHQTPIGNDTFDTAFNDSNSHALTMGVGYDISTRLTIDLAYVGVYFQPRKIDNDVDSAFGANLDGRYTTFINIAAATVTYKF